MRAEWAEAAPPSRPAALFLAVGARVLSLPCRNLRDHNGAGVQVCGALLACGSSDSLHGQAERRSTSQSSWGLCPLAIAKL